jgi:hypothetical protein
MITNSGATPGSESFRPLNPPIPIEVRESAHQTPRVIKVNGRWRRVISIDDLCNVDEEWWRERPIVRMGALRVSYGSYPLIEKSFKHWTNGIESIVV